MLFVIIAYLIVKIWRSLPILLHQSFKKLVLTKLLKKDFSLANILSLRGLDLDLFGIWMREIRLEIKTLIAISKVWFMARPQWLVHSLGSLRSDFFDMPPIRNFDNLIFVLEGIRFLRMCLYTVRVYYRYAVFIG